MPAEHPAPALKNICGGLRRAHGKGYRCSIDQDAQQHISFCRFKQQLNVVPRKNQCQNQNDQRNAAVGTDADDGQQNRIEAGKVQRRKL